MGDDKDWTWVLERPCDECGFHANTLARGELGPRMRAVGGTWRELINRGTRIHQLSDNDDRTWTPLQYGCHVRDEFEIFEERARKMLKKRKPPTFKDWDQDEEADRSNYAEQDPAKVAYDLASNAGKFADLLDRVHGEDWDKEGMRSDGAKFTVESLARYALHDTEHHLWDARDQTDD